jgi:hypothetical protein
MDGAVEQLLLPAQFSQKSDIKPVSNDSTQIQPSLELESISSKISSSALERGRLITQEAGTGWDFYYLVQAFETFALQKGTPNNIDGAFIGFIKKKVSQPVA